MSLPTIKLGNDNIPAIAWGAMGLSSFYGTIPADEERYKLLDTLHAMGLRNWDTANAYGDSEDLLGKWFKRTGKRDDIFLATKCGFVMGPSSARIDGSPANIKAAIATSLKLLGTDHIDLYYLHRPDPTVPIETSVGALAELVKEGKVKYIGLSDVNGATLRRACAVHPITAVQVEYSPFELGIESAEVGLLAAARELGVTVFAYSPLGRGMLSGRYKSPDDLEPTDNRRHFPRFSKENFPKVLKIVDGLQQIGARHDATPGQVALAWLFGQGNVVPVFGASRIQTAEENVGSLKVKLSAEELQEVRDVAERSEASTGPRYPEWMTVQSFVDTPPL